MKHVFGISCSLCPYNGGHKVSLAVPVVVRGATAGIFFAHATAKLHINLLSPLLSHV